MGHPLPSPPCGGFRRLRLAHGLSPVLTPLATHEEALLPCVLLGRRRRAAVALVAAAARCSCSLFCGRRNRRRLRSCRHCCRRLTTTSLLFLSLHPPPHVRMMAKAFCLLRLPDAPLLRRLLLLTLVLSFFHVDSTSLPSD